jgi:hypothetical protein
MIGSNPITSFMGYLLRDVSPEEKNSMFRTITDAGPGLNSIFKWTRPQNAIVDTIRRESASAREKHVGTTVDIAIQKIKEEAQPYNVVARDILAQKELNSLEKRDALKMVKDNMKGWKIYKHYMDQQGNEFIYDIPSYREWQAISTADVESKAKWYKANLPPKDDVAYTPYRNLAKAFGFLRSRKFFYYLRQVEKGK